MNAKTIILAGLLITATSAALAGNIYIPIDIDPPHKDEVHLGDDTPSKGGGKPEPATNHFSDIELTSHIVEAIGPIGPGPATPKAPGGILVVDDNPPIVILDDGVGSGGPGAFGVDGKAGGALVIRLACIVKAQGLVLSNVGETDAPQGLKLRWRVGADKGSLQLDKRLDAGHTALLPGIEATAGEACGIKLLS